jgi:hypothetical protein
MYEEGRLSGCVGKLVAERPTDRDDLAIRTFNQDLVVESEISKRKRLIANLMSAGETRSALSRPEV